jgi:hypothetical protein
MPYSTSAFDRQLEEINDRPGSVLSHTSARQASCARPTSIESASGGRPCAPSSGSTLHRSTQAAHNAFSRRPRSERRERGPDPDN